MSDLFRYDIKKLTTSEKFESEHQMESFLYNNPQILGSFRDEYGKFQSPAVIRQFPTIRGENKKGYIDLMALSQDEDSTFILKIIELKKTAKKEDFDQLKDYLTGLEQENPTKKEILSFIRDNSENDTEKELEKVYNQANGIFIACDFEPELIVDIKEWNDFHSNNPIDLFKLLLFKTPKSTYVVLDKIISISGKPKGKRFTPSWEELSNYYPELTIGDLFYINPKYTSGDKIYVRTTNLRLNVALTQESIKLMRKKDYLGKAKVFGTDPENFTNFSNPEHMVKKEFPKKTWNNKSFKKILSGELSLEEAEKKPITLSNLLQLVLLANEFNNAGWIPAPYYIHEKTGKQYKYFRDGLKEKS